MKSLMKTAFFFCLEVSVTGHYSKYVNLINQRQRDTLICREMIFKKPHKIKNIYTVATYIHLYCTLQKTRQRFIQHEMLQRCLLTVRLHSLKSCFQCRAALSRHIRHSMVTSAGLFLECNISKYILMSTFCSCAMLYYILTHIFTFSECVLLQRFDRNTQPQNEGCGLCKQSCCSFKLT